ncbi:MAG: hypothetical protein WDN26_14455 [Chitinophagaceae bacterium]
MRKLLFILPIIFLNWRCDPRPDIFQPSIEIKAQVINPKTDIQLGDSVAFYFEVPDSIELDGKKIKATAINRDGANIGFFANKIIPSSTGGFSGGFSENTCNVYANPGNISYNTFTLANQNGKLWGKYYMIPQQKGVYFFEQTQDGYIDLNNGGLKLRFTFNFGNINRNHQILIDSAGTTYNFASFLQGKLNDGLEVYGFRVK